MGPTDSLSHLTDCLVYRFWDAHSGEVLHVIGGLSELVSCQLFSCCFSTNGYRCALGAEDSNIHLLNVDACLSELQLK